MPPTVFRIAHQAVALAAIRLTLAAAGFAAGLVAGADPDAAGVALAFGAAVTGAALVSDRRWLLARRPSFEPLPADARRTGLSRAIATGLLPSTAGVAVLVAASLPFEPILAAVLAGVLAGMGLVGLVGFVELFLSERRDRARLFADAENGTRRYVGPP